jgi:hypothetical protein
MLWWRTSTGILLVGEIRWRRLTGILLEEEINGNIVVEGDQRQY